MQVIAEPHQDVIALDTLTIIASQGGFAPDAAPVHVVVAADSPSSLGL